MFFMDSFHFLRSFLSGGIVQPWEWGVPSEDIALLLKAEALTLQQQHQSQEVGVAVLDLIDEVEKTESQLRMSLSNTHPPAVSVSSSHVGGVSATDVRAYHATTTAHSYQQLRLALAAAQEKSCTTKAFDHVTLVPSGVLSSQINNIYDKIANIRRNICTADDCKLWSDFRSTLHQVSEEVDATLLNEYDLATHKSSISNNLTKILNGDIVILRSVVEKSARQLDPKCRVISEDSTMDMSDCLHAILIYGLDAVLDSAALDQPPKMGSNVHVEREEDGGGCGGGSSECDKDPLEAKIHTLFLSEEFESLFTVATENSLKEAEIHDICIAMTKKILGMEMNRDKLEVAARILGARSHDHHTTSATTTTSEDKYLVDFSRAPQGGRVVSAEKKSLYPLTTPPYIPAVLTGLLGGYGDASIMISSVFPPALGDCYAFTGRSGNVTVLLSRPTVIQKIGVFQKHGGGVSCALLSCLGMARPAPSLVCEEKKCAWSESNR